jgi:hypothetical protein
VAAPIVPPGLQPAIAWCADRPHHLRIVGDRLTWLTGGGPQPTYYWEIALAQVGVGDATGRLLVPGDAPEVTLPDGTVVPNASYNNVDACCERDGTLYYHRDDAIHARSSAGEDHRFAALPPTDHPAASRSIEELTWIGDRLYAVASESVLENAREWRRHVVVCAFGQGGDLVQVFRSAAMPGWPCRIRVANMSGRLAVRFNDRGYLIDRHGVVALPRWPTELGGAQPVPGGGVGWTATRMVEYDPIAGRLGRTLLEREIEHPAEASAVAVRDWYYLHLAGRPHDALIGVRADGSGESHHVIAVDAELTDVCSDGAALYWLARDAGAVCRARLGADGAPCPVVVADLPAALAPPTLGGTGRGAAFAKVAPPSLETVAVVQGAHHGGDAFAAAPHATPWWGWLALALARYHRVHSTLATAVADRSWLDGEHDVSDAVICAVRGEWIHVTSADLRARIAVASVREGGGLRVVPEPVFSSAYTGFAAWVAYRIADEPPAPIEARLWRWLPGRDLIEAAARFLVESLGGSVDRAGWMRLPEAVVALAAEDAESAPGVATLAMAVGDAEVAWPTDLARRFDVRGAHDTLIDALLDQGAEEIAEALPVLRPGAALTAACDRLLAAPGASGIALDRVLRVLKANPDVPPSERLRVITANVTARGDNRHFALCAQYLVESGTDRDRVRAAIRLAAGVGVLAPAGATPGLVTPFLILPALIVDPGVGIDLLRRLMRRADDWQQPQAVAMLVAIGAPWCAWELRIARADAVSDEQRRQLDHALELLAGTAALEIVGDAEVYHWRVRLSELTSANREAVALAGVRAG